MKKIWILMVAMALASCKETPPQPQQSLTQIVAYVHWQSEGLTGRQIVLVQTGDTLQTDSNGLAKFSVPAGHYVVRAFGINRGGPVGGSIDFSVDTHSGETATVDIIDCLPCVAATP